MRVCAFYTYIYIESPVFVEYDRGAYLSLPFIFKFNISRSVKTDATERVPLIRNSLQTKLYYDSRIFSKGREG